jgi:Xaa-Pro aminopeptidase
MTRFTRDEYEARWKKVHAEMKRLGFEAAVIWSRSGGGYDRAGNVLWLTDYATHASGQEPSFGWNVGSSFAAVLMRPGYEPELHTIESLAGILDGTVACGEKHQHGNLAAGVAQRVRELGLIDNICYVGDDTLPADFHRLMIAAAPEIRWTPCDHLLYRPQLIKSPAELDAYREAGEVAGKALGAMMEALIAGEMETEAAARAAGIIMRAGGGFHRLSMNHGPGSRAQMWSDPFYSFSKSRPQKGDIVRGWVYGPIMHGYWIDPGRTAVCGNKPTAAQKRVIEDCAMVVEELRGMYRPGLTARDIGKAGDKLAQKVGFFDSEQGLGQWPIYGHGTGTFWQFPVPVFAKEAETLDPEIQLVDTPYEAGMVVSSEFFLSDPEGGSAAFEQNFIITETGQELLTKTPMIWW